MGSGGGSRRSSTSRSSGSKAGSSSAGEGGGGLTCELSFEVELSGIDSDVLDTCEVGELLTVGANDAAIICRKHTGEIVGSVIGVSELSTLLFCLGEGVAYEATITAKSDFLCSVRIENS